MPRLIGYRKFIVAAAFWASATALCAFGRMSGAEFVTVAGLVTGLYGAANVTARFSGGQQ
jgi:hypothetical protein